ncbi:MAG: glycosyltransferase family 4 protein [Candidatus Korobacteraceae bacterium]
MRYLMVSTYPPTRCGIGAYAEQSVAQLRAQGHIVDVVSPDGQGNVDFAWELRGGARILRLFQLLPYYDKICIQYHWGFFYNNPFLRGQRWETLKTTLCFMLLYLRTRRIEVIAHEVPYIPGKQGWLYKWQWKLAPKTVFHTQKECEEFEQHFGIRLKRSRIEFRGHDEVYQKFAEPTQLSARRQLGLSPQPTVFLCIGFIQRHKGFHRAIRAFAEAGLRDAQLFIVGSLRVADSENRKYLAELQELMAGHSNIHLVESFVSNEDFDTWIAASDCVVLPYIEIWSSAVLGRAKLFDRPAIVSAVGGLPDQSGEYDLLFSTDQELTSAFQTAAERLGRSTVSSKQ